MTLLFEPLAPLFEVSRELDRLLSSGNGSGPVRGFAPPADVIVTDDDVTVVMDVPGFKPSELDVELADDVLTVRGERSFPYQAPAENGRTWHRIERGFGRFERVLRVPKGLDPDAIEGTAVDGVLTLRIPMPAARRPRRIDIAGAHAHDAIEGSSVGAASDQRELAGAAA